MIIKYLDKDWYEVEKDENGNKIIHDYGYYYCSPSDDDEECYRQLDYIFLYLDPEKLRNEEGYYDEEQSKVTQYIEDLNEIELVSRINNEIKKAKPLPMKQVTNDTPCGYYVDAEE